jgi:acyl carrier protein
MSDVKEVLAEILSEKFGIHPEEILLTSHLVNDLGADSLDMTELVIEIEEEFHIEVADEDVEGKKTVGDWVDFIQAKKAA